MDWMNESDNDYFEPESVPEEKPHVETTEEREERELRETTIERAHNRRRLFFMCLAGVLLLVIVGAVWVRYYHPYLESNERGVITSVANKGMALSLIHI